MAKIIGIHIVVSGCNGCTACKDNKSDDNKDTGHDGPAMVASDKFRTGWDGIFGPKRQEGGFTN